MTVQLIIEGDLGNVLADIQNLAASIGGAAAGISLPLHSVTPRKPIDDDAPPTLGGVLGGTASAPALNRPTFDEVKRMTVLEIDQVIDTHQLNVDKHLKKPEKLTALEGLLTGDPNVAPATPSAKTFSVKNFDGSVDASFDDPAEAARTLIGFVAAAQSVEQLDMLESINALVVGELPEEVRNPTAEAIEARYADFIQAEGSTPAETPAAETPAPAAGDESALTTQFKEFLAASGFASAKALLDKFGVERLSMLPEDQYEAFAAAMAEQSLAA